MTTDEIRKSREALFGLRELLHRCVMYDVLSPRKTDLNFFRIYQGSLMDSISVDWCKFFGKNAECSHWKKLVVDVEPFREKLNRRLVEDDLGTLNDVWDTMKGYRDKAAAHLDFNESKRPKCYPSLKAAKVTAELLYQELYARLQREQEHHDHVDPSQITGDSRKGIVAHNAELFSVCLDALDGWNNESRP
ncbi:hypothetical protein [Pacificibacter marinus]|uniref:hypothetical protein n=1 Tax=Pacificibacter marinus TaxID=658057 RepID=UPI001C06CBA9|nr:hypothetical protein [Pacificibacter marinus]MBU2867058.1 hypothetical protein [Pacificibacter marinus]